MVLQLILFVIPTFREATPQAQCRFLQNSKLLAAHGLASVVVDFIRFTAKDRSDREQRISRETTQRLIRVLTDAMCGAGDIHIDFGEFSAEIYVYGDPAFAADTRFYTRKATNSDRTETFIER